MEQFIDLGRVFYAAMRIVKGDTVRYQIKWTDKTGTPINVRDGKTWKFKFITNGIARVTLVPTFVDAYTMAFTITGAQLAALTELKYNQVGVMTDSDDNVYTKIAINTQFYYPKNGPRILTNDYITAIDYNLDALPKLATPTLTAGTPGQNNIPLSFPLVTHATSTVVRKSVNPDMSEATLIYSGTDESFNDQGLEPDTHYYYDAVQSGAGYSNSDAATASASTIEAGGLTEFENLYDVVLKAAGSTTWDDVNHVPTGIVAQQGDQVGKVSMLKGGWQDTTYMGNYTLTMGGKVPTLQKTNGLSTIVFKNIPECFYLQGGQLNIPPPRDLVRVFIKLPGTENEERAEGGDNKDLIGDNNGVVRIVSAQYGQLNNVPAPLPYILHIERVVAKPDNTVDYWRDGVYQATMPLQNEDINNYVKKENWIGVASNNSGQAWVGEYHLAEIMDDDTFALVYANLVQIYSAPVKIKEILLDNFTFTNVGGMLTPSFDIDNQLPEGRIMSDPSTWPTTWWQDFGGLDVQTLFHTGPVANVSQMNPDGGDYIKCLTMPVDTNGQGFCFLETQYKHKND